jgi:voltage-gated potassium channel
VNPKQRIIFLVILISGVILLGTIGYSVVEGWDLFDSLYMTVITLTTVGYQEVHGLSHPGRIFTIVLILAGVGTMLYSLSVGAKLLLEGELREIFGRRKLSKNEKLENHLICGYGRMGKIICRK